MRALREAFEHAASAQARLAHPADRAMPLPLDLANSGQHWRENGISHARVLQRIGPPIRQDCPALWNSIEGRMAHAREHGWFGT